MNFQSPIFYAFFIFFFLLYHFGNLHFKKKLWILIFLTNCFWIGLVNISALSSVLITTILTWYCGHKMQQSGSVKKKIWFSFGIFICLANWLLIKGSSLAPQLGASFYTLQLLGYLIELNEAPFLKSIKLNLFLTTNSVFYTFSSGPIFKIREQAQQLLDPNKLSFQIIIMAFFRITWGLAKKTIGTLLAEQVAAYSMSGSQSLFATWTLVLSITAEYYVDFSGYSDIAIGLASLLGVKIPENFNLPFFATSMADHWRRWHITLSQWIHEFVFIPLCFSNFLSPLTARFRIIISVMVSLGLAGLWHGFKTNNLIWGFYNGLLILIGLGLQKKLHPYSFAGKKILAVFFTFYCGLLGRVLTRVDSWPAALQIWLDLHALTNFNLNLISSEQILILTLTVIAILLPHSIDWFFINKLKNSSRFGSLAFLIFINLLFVFMFGPGGKPFLYEQH